MTIVAPISIYKATNLYSHLTFSGHSFLFIRSRHRKNNIAAIPIITRIITGIMIDHGGAETHTHS